MGGHRPSSHNRLIDITARLSLAVDELQFTEPVRFVYNPLKYAWNLHKQYLQRFGNGQKDVLFLGMNPGPWGMAQTGVPFGEISAVRDWMSLTGSVGTPEVMHPKRQIKGLACSRSEVSGSRLWGWVQQYYGSPEAFFANHFVINYCPLVFMADSARNITPDKLSAIERCQLGAICDEALCQMIEHLQPKLVVGVGIYAEKQAMRAVETLGHDIQVGRVLHPSPASPVANRGWAAQAQKQLEELDAL